MSVMREQPTKNLFLLEELEDVSRTRSLRKAIWMRFAPSQTGSRRSWPGLTRISDALGPCVRSCLEPWSATLFGLRLSGSRTGVCQMLSSSSVVSTSGVNRAGAFFGDVLEHLAVPSYVKDGFVMGGFYEGNEGTAIYSTTFRPFTSPVPFLLVRQAVVGDWRFFLDNKDWLNLSARRYGDSGVKALAVELRRLPWRAGRD